MKQSPLVGRSSTRKNMVCFGLGTVGRDMFYTFETQALLYMLTKELNLGTTVFAIASTMLTVLRIIDALNDPITGLVIDRIRTPWGRYKPAILVGGLASVVFYLMLFANIGSGAVFLAVFGVAYVLWDISFGVNDIAYWTLLPALTSDQKLREKYGSFARICANIGMYIVILGWIPAVDGVKGMLGGSADEAMPVAYLIVAGVICVFYMGFQLFTLLGVKENRRYQDVEEKTTLRQMFGVLKNNDQLMWTALSMGLFMVGYCSSTSMAVYYMEYVFGDKNMYIVLAGICGVSQLASLILFPAVSRKFNRNRLYGFSTLLVVLGCVIFFAASYLGSAHLMVMAVAAIMIFVGQAFIQMLMLMFLADTIEYGQWKTGKRNESITFSIQPVVNKIGGALATGVCSIAIMIAGIVRDDLGQTMTDASAVDASGKLAIKLGMLVIPLVFIGVGYIIYRKKFKISEEFYAKMLSDLKERGELDEE